MRVLMVSKACLVGAYQRKLEEMARNTELELTVVTPPAWRDERGVTPLERAHVQGYRLATERVAFNGNFHAHFYPGLRRWFEQVRPELVHLDEEPYNLATWHGLRLARRYGARAIFFSWQNLSRAYPPPFGWMEHQVLRQADGAIAGSQACLQVWRKKGYLGLATVLPQFGVDPQAFSPDGRRPASGDDLVIGYAGRLVPEKGVDLLLEALHHLSSSVRARVLGSGPARGDLQRRAQQLGLGDRVSFEAPIASTAMPGFYRTIDALVLPSRSRPNWREQFGRVLVEAMACGAVAVGSTCGEIPHVIGDAGLVFPENDAAALAECLRRLQADTALRARLAAHGRQRVLDRYTHRRIADETVAFYKQVLGQSRTPQDS